MITIKVPYKALTTDINRSAYNNYVLLKGYADGRTQKNGFIKRSEVESVAQVAGYSKYTLIKKLNELTSTGLINKNKYGYTLTSTRIINHNLNFNHTNGRGEERTPYFKYDLLPSANNNYQIELIKMYYLIKQIYSRYRYATNASKSDKRKKLPESFELSLEKIMKRGKYTNKMTVRRYVYDLEHIGLIQIERGKKNDSGYYDCNKYSLQPLYRVNWNKLSVPNQSLMNRSQRWEFMHKEDWKKKKKPVLALKKKNKKVEYNAVEKLLRKSIGKNLTRNQMSKFLIFALNNTETRKRLFEVLTPEQINVDEKESYYFDIRPKTYCYDRYHYFKHHNVNLVEAAGNFNGFEDEYLFSREERIEGIRKKLHCKPSD